MEVSVFEIMSLSHVPSTLTSVTSSFDDVKSRSFFVYSHYHCSYNIFELKPPVLQWLSWNYYEPKCSTYALENVQFDGSGSFSLAHKVRHFSLRYFSECKIDRTPLSSHWATSDTNTRWTMDWTLASCTSKILRSRKLCDQKVQN